MHTYLYVLSYFHVYVPEALERAKQEVSEARSHLRSVGGGDV